ncbi:hypothetical protein P0W64_09590 [Tsukamurella sp. 8F]|uniref:hypothetical protein n=1 Tax=unclassified Tsukamurella TaxID=2633480 RepID=UPI0023BA3A81|nr:MULTISPECIES: hypothetical protein [unclassified Tsukamurella]MDF0529831.1 hypothetical protein [Tsukamurella sp. 8J]MDF0587023.1 hypothetical protein [Tsukamurella sp. 8F]
MGKVVSYAVRMGILLFAVGLVAIIALFVTPAVDHGVTAPLWVYLCTPLAPIGLVLAIAAVVVGGIRR